MKQTLLSLLILFSVSTFAQTTYLHCGKLIDPASKKVENEMTVMVEGNTITGVQKGYATPAEGATLIDLKNMTVSPGLIDLHVHIESESNPRKYLEKFTDNEADVAFKSITFAKKTLMAGFTTVRDLGGSGVNIALKKAIQKGYVDGPRVYTAGKSIATTGGHADPTNGMKRTLRGDPGPKEGVVNSLEDGRKAVRQRYKNGADCIKITATGGVLSVAKSGMNPQFQIEEIKEITKTAADYGYYVAAHAHGDEGMRRAVLGGVKTIEHGTFMSTETMDLMKKNDVYLVPTITAGKEVAEKAERPGFYPTMVAIKARAIGPLMQAKFTEAYERGVPIAFGTDAGVFAHGDNMREFFYMEEAGMPLMEVFQSATTTNAMLLKEEETLGQVKKGFLADIIAFEGDPFDDVQNLNNVVFVMKDGVVYKSK